MGGAFIAVADDATAASWNPGGLIQLERPEISIVGAGFHRTEDNRFGTNPEASGLQRVSNFEVNYFSAVHPFTFGGRNMVVSLNYQNLYDLTRQWDYPFVSNSAGLVVNKNVDYSQEGSLAALGLAYCVRMGPSLSLGLTLNFWDDGLMNNVWEQRTRQTGSGTNLGNAFTFSTDDIDRYTLSGLNANIGLLWNVSDRLTLGAVLKTPFEADLRHESWASSSIHYPASPGSDSTSSSSSVEDETLDMPTSVGVGAAYRFSDALTASLDVYRTEWGDFVLTDARGNETSFVTGQAVGSSDIGPTHQVRMGAEYLVIRSKYAIPFRCGVFYDPAPAQGNPDDYYGLSAGSGIAAGRFVFDIAYQYRFGNDVGTSILQGLDFSQDVEEHTVYSSLIVHF